MAQSTAVLPLEAPSRPLSLASCSVQLGWKLWLVQKLLHPVTPSQVVSFALCTGCRGHRVCTGHRQPAELDAKPFLSPLRSSGSAAATGSRLLKGEELGQQQAAAHFSRTKMLFSGELVQGKLKWILALPMALHKGTVLWF